MLNMNYKKNVKPVKVKILDDKEILMHGHAQ